MAIYEIIMRFESNSGKTSFGLMKDKKDNINPSADELKTYFSVLKLVMDKVGIRLKNELTGKSPE